MYLLKKKEENPSPEIEQGCRYVWVIAVCLQASYILIQWHKVDANIAKATVLHRFIDQKRCLAIDYISLSWLKAKNTIEYYMKFKL